MLFLLRDVIIHTFPSIREELNNTTISIVSKKVFEHVKSKLDLNARDQMETPSF